MKNKAEQFLKSKGINIDYAKGIDLLQELGQKKYNIVELMEQFCQYDVSSNEGLQKKKIKKKPEVAVCSHTWKLLCEVIGGKLYECVKCQKIHKERN